MPRGRNFFGPGFWKWNVFSWPYFGYGFWGWGGGRGNPFPFCRWFPWLPRWWWATPYASYYTSTIPYYMNYPFYFSGGQTPSSSDK